MKMTRKLALAAAIVGAGFTAVNTGCVYEGPPHGHVAVGVGFVPDYCFWDGFEYVGWYGGAYYYWGPSETWIICDRPRAERISVWVNAHPRWRTRTVTVAPAPTYDSGHSSPPSQPPPARRYYHERGHGHGHD